MQIVLHKPPKSQERFKLIESSLVIASTSIAANVKKKSARANTFLKEVALKRSHFIPLMNYSSIQSSSFHIMP